MPSPDRLIIGVTGATGIVYALKLLDLLADNPIETHLIVSKAAELTLHHELPGLKVKDLTSRAKVVHSINDLAAGPASGSFRTRGMVVIPCSMKTLAEIATGMSTNLLTRAADVTLKERRRLVLVPRETPLNLIHLRNLTTVTEAGGIVFPPVPAFYTMPQSVDELITATAARVLDLMDLDVPQLKRWGDPGPSTHRGNP
jgi:4-hydroxy-3-polyprenylbenzoate decarboxylase